MRVWQKLALIGLLSASLVLGCDTGGGGDGSVLSGELDWVKAAGGAVAYLSQSVTALSDGSIVVTGDFRGTATFDPGGPNEATLTSAGEADVLIARYSPEGVFAWARRVGGENYDSGLGVVALSDDSVVVTGNFGGSVTFGEGELNETTLTSDALGGGGVFVARYDADGSLSWAVCPEGNGTGFAVKRFSDESVAVTGSFSGTTIFGPGESNETTLESAYGDDVFVARYMSDGALTWAVAAGGDQYDWGWDVAVLSDDSVVVTGQFDNDLVFDQGGGNEMTLTSVGSNDVFIARYDSDGELLWAKRAGGTDYDVGLGLTALSGDSICMTGYFKGSAAFGEGEPNATTVVSAGEADVFLARFGSDGALAWAVRAGGPGMDIGRGVAAPSDHSLVTVGGFFGTAAFGEGGPRETTLTSVGELDIFLACYGSDGMPDWARRAGGGGNDSGNCVAVLPDGSVAVIGVFVDTATFGPGEPGETELTSTGVSTIFVARYGY